MTTENLKREMYAKLKESRVWAAKHLDAFEGSLEDYLESLRQELSDMTRLRHCYETLAVDYTNKSVALTEERDELRNRLQAFEFANKACGEELRAASELIQRQREFIRTLYTSRKTRKTKGSTSAQSSCEKCSGEVLGAIPRPCQHSWRHTMDFLSGTSRDQCIYCLAFRE